MEQNGTAGKHGEFFSVDSQIYCLLTCYRAGLLVSFYGMHVGLFLEVSFTT